MVIAQLVLIMKAAKDLTWFVLVEFVSNVQLIVTALKIITALITTVSLKLI